MNWSDLVVPAYAFFAGALFGFFVERGERQIRLLRRRSVPMTQDATPQLDERNAMNFRNLLRALLGPQAEEFIKNLGEETDLDERFLALEAEVLATVEPYSASSDADQARIRQAWRRILASHLVDFVEDAT